MSGGDAPQAPTELSEDARWRLVDAGITGDDYIPVVDCPHPAGTPAAEQWWRDEWKKATAWAFAHGDLDVDLDDTVPKDVPPYPVHALPPLMRDVAETIAANKCVPVDLAANLLFALLSMAAGPRLIIDRGKDWREALILWTLTILEVGEKKTPAFSVIGDIVKELERHLAAEHRAVIDQQIGDLRDEVAAMKAGVSDEVKPGKPIAEQIRAREARIEALENDPPKPPRLRIGAGSTSEAIEKALARNGGHLAILDDESAVFGNVSGVYNGGIPTGLDTLLKAADGSSIPANERIRREVDAIGRACLTLGITCQPRPVFDSFRVPQLRERGFHARWSYSMPNAVVELLDPPDLDYATVDRFVALLKNILARPVIDSDQPMREWPALTLSTEARKLHQELQQEFIDRRKPDTGDLGHMVDWANKFAGRVLRFAGLIHVAAGRGLNTDVDEDTMQAAITIGRYMILHADEVFRRAPKEQRGKRDEDPTVAVARFRVEQWVKKQRRTHFTARDVHQTVRRQAWCHEARQVDVALINLANDWVVRQVPRRDSVGRTLPANPWWVPNPRLIFGEEAA